MPFGDDHLSKRAWTVVLVVLRSSSLDMLCYITTAPYTHDLLFSCFAPDSSECLAMRGCIILCCFCVRSVGVCLRLSLCERSGQGRFRSVTNKVALPPVTHPAARSGVAMPPHSREVSVEIHAVCCVSPSNVYSLLCQVPSSDIGDFAIRIVLRHLWFSSESLSSFWSVCEVGFWYVFNVERYFFLGFFLRSSLNNFMIEILGIFYVFNSLMLEQTMMSHFALNWVASS